MPYYYDLFLSFFTIIQFQGVPVEGLINRNISMKVFEFLEEDKTFLIYYSCI